MVRIFEEFKEKVITHKNYSGIVCGYNDEHFILAIKASSPAYSFRKLPKGSFIMDEYKDIKFKYVYENESELIKQSI